MSEKVNVLKFDMRKPTVSKASQELSSQAPVVDMTGRRDEILQEERRKVRRTMLREFIGVHVVVPQLGLLPVALHDISGGGLAFEVPSEKGRFRTGDELTMRVYLNQHTYFAFNIKITNVRNDLTQPLVRHGASFVPGTVNEEALHHFVRFMESVSASLKTDSGDVTVNKLSSVR